MSKKNEKSGKEKKIGLRSKLRFSIFNDTSHEELFFFRGKGLMILVGFAMGVILIIGLVAVLISFTPLREFIPGYPSAQTRQAIVRNAIKADSLEQVVKMWDFQLGNIQRIVNGMEPLSATDLVPANPADSVRNVDLTAALSKEDSLLRLEVIQQERFNIRESTIKIEQLEGLHMFPPVKGIISDEYNLAINHPFIDIASPENMPVSSILDGTVIMAVWTEDSGYTIQVQHDNDLISIYKHNSKLLKKSGDKVTAGTVIALTGNTGTLSMGSHLHFELWHQGNPVDPAKYINF